MHSGLYFWPSRCSVNFVFWTNVLNMIGFCCCFQVKNIPDDPCHRFLLDFAQSDPAQNFCGPYSELFKGFIQACRKQAPKTDIVAGSTIDQAVNATFAALVYRTPDLYEKLQKYGNLYYREYFSSEGQLLSFKKA